MKRLFSLFVVLFCFGAISFAQSAPVKILSDTDIDTFIANFNTIDESMTALGDKYDDYDDYFGNSKDPVLMLNEFRSKKIPQEIQDIMVANGLGKNGMEKMLIITMGAGAFFMESMLFSEGIDLEANPEMQALVDQINSLKTAIHADDLELIESRSDEIITFINSY